MHKLRSAYEDVVLNEVAPYTYTKDQFCEEDLEYYYTVKLKKDPMWFNHFKSWLYRKSKTESWTTTHRMKDIILWLRGWINDVATEIEQERITDLTNLFKAKKITYDKFSAEMEKLLQGSAYVVALETTLWDLGEEFEEFKKAADAIKKASDVADVNLDI
jgi:hypothetical protein